MFDDYPSFSDSSPLGGSGPAPAAAASPATPFGAVSPAPAAPAAAGSKLNFGSASPFRGAGAVPAAFGAKSAFGTVPDRGGANVYYRGTVALGRTGMIPAAHVYEGGLRKVGMPGMSGD